MAKIITVADLGHGGNFYDTLFSRSEIERKAGSGNGPDIKLSLAQNFQRYSAKKWKLSKTEEQVISDSQFLVVSGSVEKDGNYAGEVTIISVREATEDEIPGDITPYMKPVHKDHQEHIARFDFLTALVQDIHLSKLLHLIFDKDKPYWAKFCQACAAEKMHHAYQGGLLHHTVEVAELCKRACETMPGLSLDLLITGALLHDIGKLEEIDHGLNAGAYTDAGILNGHITAGVIMMRPFMKQKLIPGFPTKLKDSLTHMIASHHGSREFGSPQPPAFTEAYVLSECDMMSAKVFQYQNAIFQKKTWLPGADKIRLYTGDLGVTKTRELSSVVQPVSVFATQTQVPPLQTFKTRHLPIRGLVAAGSPDQSSEEDEEIHEVTLPNNGADYLLRVTGDSMIDAGIAPDDLLFVKAQNTAVSGEIVIANLASHGDVVKRLRRERRNNDGLDQDWLDSENRSANYDPIRADENTHIHGIVVGLLKA
jgi:3'-5' exoribonuclease